MDGGLNDNPTSNDGLVGGNAASPLSLREAFEQACPLYMSYGMTRDEFWNGDTSAHKDYRESHKLKIIEQNTMNWYQGRYVYEAIGAWAPIIRAFSKARKPGDYPEHPYDLFEEQRKAREEEEQRKRYERIKEKVALFATEYNKQRNSEGKEVEDNA